MANVKPTVSTLLLLIGIAVGIPKLAALAQNPRTTTSVGSLPVTVSTLVSVSPGATFDIGDVDVPTCPKDLRFLVTEVQASPYLPTLGDKVVNLPKWAVSVHVSQLASNGSFSPYLTVFGNGPEHASTSIGGGQPIATGESGNVTVRLLGTAPAVYTPFAVHVTGHCGIAVVAP
jgi:hypothetical protein